METIQVSNPELQSIADRILASIPVERTGPASQITCNSQINRSELEKRGIFRRYQECSLASIEKRGIPDQVAVRYQKVVHYVNNLAANIDAGTGLILKGPVGTMKTTLAVAILREHLEKGGSGLFIPMPSLLDNLFTMKAKDVEEWLRYEDKLRNTGLLVLDDLGAEYHQEWVLSKVDAIISERYNRMRPIIVTTNLSTEELKGKYAERVLDRLRATSLVVNFDGESLRSKPNS